MKLQAISEKLNKFYLFIFCWFLLQAHIDFMRENVGVNWHSLLLLLKPSRDTLDLKSNIEICQTYTVVSVAS